MAIAPSIILFASASFRVMVQLPHDGGDRSNKRIVQFERELTLDLDQTVKINVPLSGEEHGFGHALHPRRKANDAPVPPHIQRQQRLI